MNETCNRCGCTLLWNGGRLECPWRGCTGEPRGGGPRFLGRASQVTAPPVASPSEINRGVAS